jgi:nucleoside-diphosphate-sugar epimerase
MSCGLCTIARRCRKISGTPRPERVLPETNTKWFANLLTAALEAQVGRVVLISFPHVEGPTSVAQPATGRLDRQPISVHAQTRLEEERLLIERTKGSRTTPVILRLGLVYGRGVLMIEAARWLARRRLLCVWREPTTYQLASVIDSVRAVEAAMFRPGIRGIYHVGDERPVTFRSSWICSAGRGAIRVQCVYRSGRSMRRPASASVSRPLRRRGRR